MSLTFTFAESNSDSLDKIGLKEAHEITRGSNTIRVALLTSTINCTLPQIKNNIERLSSSNDQASDACLRQENERDFIIDYGTFSASLILRVAPNITIIPIRIFNQQGAGSSLQTLEALNMAHSLKPDIIAVAGGGFMGTQTLKAFCDFANRAHDDGISIVAPAGNEGREINAETGFFYSSCRSPNLFSAAGLNKELDNLASFSNYSAHYVQLAAPAMEVSALNSNGESIQMAGTSTSFLIATGALALRKSLHPNEDVTLLREALLRAADRLPALIGKVESEGSLNLLKALD